MSAFKRFYSKEKLIPRVYDIDEKLYEKLAYLKENVYDASINQLVNASIEYLLETNNVHLIKTDYKVEYVSRSYLIRESFLYGLEDLHQEYGLPLYKLVNLAIYNALKEEKI